MRFLIKLQYAHRLKQQQQLRFDIYELNFPTDQMLINR